MPVDVGIAEAAAMKEGFAKDGKRFHYSVGAVIEQDGRYLLLDRAQFPAGFAAVAGHINEGEQPERALIREVQEESGLTVLDSVLLIEEMVPWLVCKHGVEGHHWYIYGCRTEGDVVLFPEEAKNIGWYTLKEIKKLPLEPVWAYWFEKLGILTPKLTKK